MRLLHFSDVHVQVDWLHRPLRKIGWRRVVARLELGPGGRAKKYADATRSLGLLARRGLQPDVDHVVLSGDLTCLAHDEEFAAARQALGSLAGDPQRCTIIPGNHDVYTPGAAREDRFGRWFGDHLRSELPVAVEGVWPYVRFVGDHGAIVALTSARVPLAPGIARGWVGEAQLHALDSLLGGGALAGRTTVVAVHHAPVRADGSYDSPTHGLRDAAELLAIVERHPVAAILCGHVHHRSVVRRPSGLAIVNAGSGTRKGREGGFVLDLRGGRLQRAEPFWLDGALAGEGKT